MSHLFCFYYPLWVLYIGEEKYLLILKLLWCDWASLITQLVKNPPAVQETPVRFLGWEDPLEKGKGYPLQYSGLENSMVVTKSWTGLSDFHIYTVILNQLVLLLFKFFLRNFSQLFQVFKIISMWLKKMFLYNYFTFFVPIIVVLIILLFWITLNI